MTEPGYIDYARTSLSAGYLIAGGQQAFKAGTVLFRGYLGSWPYINFFWDAVGGTAHDDISVVYYSDSTFTTIVAEQVSVRDTNCVGYRQYAVMSPWVQINVAPDSATDNTLCTYAFYGTTQSSTAAKLGSLDAAFLEFLASVGASTTTPVACLKVYPGQASIALYSGVAGAQFSLQRWDYGSAAWVTFWLQRLNTANTTEAAIIALPDAPIQALLDNTTAAAGTIGMWIMPVMD